MGTKMEKVKVGILWDDREYADALARVLASRGQSFLPVMVDHGQDFLTDAPRERILFTNDLEVRDQRAVVLRRPVLPDTAARLIREKYEQVFGKRIPGGRSERQKRNCGVTVVTSAVGGSGVSALADGLAEEFTVYYDKKVLRLSFSAFPESGAAGRNREQKELKRLFFSFFSPSAPGGSGASGGPGASGGSGNSDGLGDSGRQESDIEKEFEPEDYFSRDEAGVWHAEYGNGVNPLAEAGEEERRRFFQAIENTGSFDLLVLDIPAEQLVRVSELLFFAENILIVKKRTPDSCRERGLLNYLRFLLGEEESEKIVAAVNATEACEEEEASADTDKEKLDAQDAPKMRRVSVSYDPAAFRTGRVRIDGSFGLAVKEVAHILSFC